MSQILDRLQQQRLCRSHYCSTTSTASCQFHFLLTSPTSTHAEVSEDGEIIPLIRFWEQLPSSLEQKSSMTAEFRSSAPKCLASVSYTVQAKLHREDILLAATSRKVKIFTCNAISPPLSLEDFAPEYSSCQKSVVRQSFFQRVGWMTIQGIQPEPFMFCGNESSPTTKVPLLVKLQMIDNSRGNHEVGTFSAAIAWRLQSSTFVSSMQMQDALPTTRQAVSSPWLGHIIKTRPTHRLKMMWSGWRRTHSTESEASEWIASYSICLSCEFCPTLPPTFSIPYVSHRYSLLLDISISGPYQSKVRLKLPIQIAYQTKSTNSQVSINFERPRTTDIAEGNLERLSDSHELTPPPDVM